MPKNTRYYSNSYDAGPKSKRGKYEEYVETLQKSYGNHPQRNKTVRDEELEKLITYFKTALQTLKTIPKDDTDVFVSNALEESKGYEVKLSCNHVSSHCIELLLSMCKDPEIWIQYMKAFSAEKIEVFTSPNASHITELLLHFAIKNLENWESFMETDEESVEKTHATYFISWVSELGEFVKDNIESCLQDQHASHVACIVIQVLGGDTSKASTVRSKKNTNHKKDFNNQYMGERTSDGNKQDFSVDFENIPKFFVSILRGISKALVKIDGISDYTLESSCGVVLETLLSVLKRRRPKSCRSLVSKLSQALFSERNEAGIPIAFLDKNISYIVEYLFQAADEEMKLKLWSNYCSECLESLIEHKIGNFIVQRLFDVVESPTLFEAMHEKIGNYFKTILKSCHFGIFLSIANACNRLKIQQGQFIRNIMQCLECAEPEDRQERLVPLVIGFSAYAQNTDYICLQGSLLAQALLKFQKPIKVVKSLLSMKPKEIFHLACHIQGCHVLNAFFSSTSVGEKNKDNMIHNMKPCFANLACDRNGGLTLSRLWVLLTVKQRGTVAQQLVQDERTLEADKNGSLLLKKCGIFHFKKNREQWKEMQNNLKASNRQNVKSNVR